MAVALLVELSKHYKRETELLNHLEIRNNIFALEFLDSCHTLWVVSLIPVTCRRLPKPKGQTVGSFRKGLTMLPEAISARYSILSYTNVLVDLPLFSRLMILGNCVPVDRLGNKVKLSWKLSSISKLDGGEYTLTYETPEGMVSLKSKTVVMTIPSYVASTLLRPLSVSFFPKKG